MAQLRFCPLNVAAGRRALSFFQPDAVIKRAVYNSISKDLVEDELLTQTCRAMQAMQKVRICQDPPLDACFTPNGENILGSKKMFCPDVIFVRSFYDDLFRLIRSNWRVILIGNPGISKSV
jgi:hypothetical protein